MMRRWMVGLAVAVVLVTGATACGDDDGDGDAADTTSTTSDADTTATDDGTTSTTGEAAAVLIGTGETDHGEVLTDTDGLTLYIFTDDAEGVSNCVDTCADIWPRVIAENVETRGELDIEVGLVDGDEAERQVTVNGRPVYTYSGDSEPGMATGQGLLGKWWVLDPDGNPIESAGATTDTTVVD